MDPENEDIQPVDDPDDIEDSLPGDNTLFRQMIWLSLIFIPLCIGAIYLVSAPAHQEPPIVTIADGSLKGIESPFGGAIFLGIPYAAPPVGPLRWKPPQPVAHWPGQRDALILNQPCTQSGNNWGVPNVVNENCLYLSIWNSEWPATTHKPVMVWFHGDGNNSGAGAASFVDGVSLAARGVVLVTFDYRLSAFGFFSHTSLSLEGNHGSGNYGLMDQIAALQWVKKNIATFGGDPDNVTVFGQSAGALDIELLLASPLSKGLFHRAIAQSSPLFSSAFGRPMPLAKAEANGKEISHILDIPDTENELADLREESPENIENASFGMAQRENGFIAPLPRAFGTTIDGKVLLQSPVKTYSQGQQLPVDLLLGTNSVEYGDDNPLKTLAPLISKEYGSLADEAMPLYNALPPYLTKRNSVDPVYGSPGTRWINDTYFRCPSQLVADFHNKAGHKVYEYQFAMPAFPGWPLSGHFAEIIYVFGNLKLAQQSHYSNSDEKISAAMQQYWVNFAKTGDPNGSGLQEWPRYTSNGNYIEFSGKGIQSHPGKIREKECKLFEKSLLSAE